MKSKIAELIRLKTSPVAVMYSNDKPEEALQFQEGKWGCVTSVINAASKGKTAVFDEKTCGCNGVHSLYTELSAGRRRQILAAIAIGNFMGPLDSSVVNIALPAIGTFFHTSLGTRGCSNLCYSHFFIAAP